MSSRGFTPPDDVEPEANVVDLTDMEDDGGEPTTKDDEFAQDDAPEQTFDEDAV
jgi:hypothetical protein